MTGSNVNHKPKVDQNGVSFARLRILYDRTTVRPCSGVASSAKGINGGDDSCIRVRSSGAKSSGKYTFCWENQVLESVNVSLSWHWNYIQDRCPLYESGNAVHASLLRQA